jgi:transposase-like protein
VEDYPRTLAEFERRFATDEACRGYLAQARWPDGFCCPKCGHRRAWPTRTVLLQCASCGRQTSVTAGTIFQDTRTPLTIWFRAMWWVTSQKTGASAKGLQQVLGLGSYETAWTWLHKLRRAMVRPGRDRLTGRVEVDQTFIGGVEEGRGHTEKKALIAVAVEQVGPGMGRVRMRHITDGSAETLQRFVEDAVAPGSLMHTDGWLGYDGLDKLGYRHRITFAKESEDPLPRVHRVVSLLKRWLLGTHQGAVTRGHLDYYLDEFTFRFNWRRSPPRQTVLPARGPGGRHRPSAVPVACQEHSSSTLSPGTHPQQVVVPGAEPE